MTANEDLRRRQLAAIHVGKKTLAMTDEAYRAMLQDVAGVSSAAELDPAGLRAVLDHMRSLGFVDGKVKRSHRGRPHNLDSVERGAQLGKVEAMLLDANLPWTYADGIAKRMFGIERVGWCDSQQLRAVITALVKKAQREGRAK
jgi:phage gp16-like protein